MRGVRSAVVPLVVLSVLGLAGCDGGGRGPAPAAVAGTRAPAPAADPLADVEASVDAIARDLDADADAGR
jgi:hypothetical protein